MLLKIQKTQVGLIVGNVEIDDQIEITKMLTKGSTVDEVIEYLTEKGHYTIDNTDKATIDGVHIPKEEEEDLLKFLDLFNTDKTKDVEVHDDQAIIMCCDCFTSGTKHSDKCNEKYSELTKTIDDDLIN